MGSTWMVLLGTTSMLGEGGGYMMVVKDLCVHVCERGTQNGSRVWYTHTITYGNTNRIHPPTPTHQHLHREGKLVDQEPMKMFAPLPVVHVTGVLAKDAAARAGHVYECPVYRTRKRTGAGFVTKLQLRTDEDPSKWVLRGAALLCSVE